MIEDAKKGKIQVVIVKDFSRLGRDYITAGDYITLGPDPIEELLQLVTKRLHSRGRLTAVLFVL